MSQKKKLYFQKEQEINFDPLDNNNPITVQVLGICSADGNNSSAKASSSNVFFSSFCFISCQRCCIIIKKV